MIHISIVAGGHSFITKSWEHVSPNLSDCFHLLRLLHAADCFPRGGLYTGYYAEAALMRYERFWMQIMRLGIHNATPPLDVAFAWFVHRQRPEAYAKYMASNGVADAHPANHRAFSLWRGVANDHPMWPPPASGSPHDALALGSSETILAGTMSRFSRLLHSWLRPHFLDEGFLTRAQERYGRFLSLHAAHPDVLLVPPADVALVWHTHLGLSGEYEAVCQALFGAAVPPWRPDYLDLSPDKLGQAYGLTVKLYMEKYGEPFDDPNTAWLPHTMPYPLAAPDSPIAWALRVFDENPEESQQRGHLSLLAAKQGTPLIGLPVVRSGAHALFAAWLAARRSEDVYFGATCGQCCRTNNQETLIATIEHTVASLVSLAFFLGLPDTDKHPYLKSIAPGKGLWNPPCHAAAAAKATTSGKDLQESKAGDHAPQLPAAPTIPTGFVPTDPARYLHGLEAERLHGLAHLLASPPAPPSKRGATSGGVTTGKTTATQPKVPRPSYEDSPLWGILARQGMAARGARLVACALELARKKGVGRMQKEYQ